MIKKTILFLAITLFLTVGVCGADTLLAGIGSDTSTSTGNFGIWKGVRYQAAASGDAAYFGIYCKTYAGDRTDDDIGFAVYSDDGGDPPSPSALMFHGCLENYDWTAQGTGVFHDITVGTVVTTRTITSGSYYWIFYGDSVGTDGDDCVWTGRYNASSCSDLSYKMGSNNCATFCVPPTVLQMTTRYNGDPLCCEGYECSGNYTFGLWNTNETIMILK